MRKYARAILWGIIVLTILAIVIDLPRNFSLNIDQKIPVINKQLSIHQTFQGFNPNFYIGTAHMQRDLSFKKGLDLQGGVSITLKANMQGVPADKQDDALQSAKLVIQRRVDNLGVSEPLIQTSTSGNDKRIIVELPGVTDVSQAVQLIGTTAQLSFWEEAASGSAEAVPASKLPQGITQTIGPAAKKTDLTGNDLQDASVTFDQNTGQPQVQLLFNSDGTRKFADITKRNNGKIVAIVLDNQVIEAPRVNQPILTGDAVITGGFTTDTAQILASSLKAGALPVPLTVLEQRQIGATLGQESLQKSLFAGTLGFIVIVVFMCLLYGRLGALASAALVLYTLFVLGIFKIIPVTLTLAGIAGFILSIGMAVDANILIFERMKEELRAGRNRDASIELGFSRAWTSIRDSNISSLITSAILYKFGTGIVRGFALTLAIGVLVSMFSAIVVTRTLLRLLYRV